MKPIRCPHCGGMNFYFRGTFETEAIWDDDSNQFVFGVIDPMSADLCCAKCDHELDENELIDTEDEDDERP